MPSLKMKDRVKELRRVRAGDLLPNSAQWRVHNKAQTDAMRGVLEEIGFAGAALAYENAEGQLVLCDGHLRSSLDKNAVIPVLVLDVNEDEAKKLLATYDPLSAMAQHDQEALLSLLDSVRFQSQAVNDMLEALANGDWQPMPPLFEPVGIDQQGRLDEKAKVTCPECGHVFAP